MAFAGTTQKCCACDKTVYLVDRLAADKRIFHKACFRCYHCKGTLKLSNFNSFEGVLYCRPHYDQLFKRTGSLDKSFDGTPKTKTDKPIDSEVAVNGTAYHKACFKCSHGGCTISPSNFIAYEGKLYCKHHHIQLFREKGNYSQLENEVAGDGIENPPPAALEVAAESRRCYWTAVAAAEEHRTAAADIPAEVDSLLVGTPAEVDTLLVGTPAVDNPAAGKHP
nr:LIM domain-containing protein WLIM1-like [Ipomoea batatas]